MNQLRSMSCLVALLCAGVFADVIDVDVSNTGTQDGLSWNTAFSDLQDAIAIDLPACPEPN